MCMLANSKKTNVVCLEMFIILEMHQYLVKNNITSRQPAETPVMALFHWSQSGSNKQIIELKVLVGGFTFRKSLAQVSSLFAKLALYALDITEIGDLW